MIADARGNKTAVVTGGGYPLYHPWRLNDQQPVPDRNFTKPAKETSSFHEPRRNAVHRLFYLSGVSGEDLATMRRR